MLSLILRKLLVHSLSYNFREFKKAHADAWVFYLFRARGLANNNRVCHATGVLKTFLSKKAGGESLKAYAPAEMKNGNNSLITPSSSLPVSFSLS